MIPRGLHVHMAGESCPIRDCYWPDTTEAAAPTAAVYVCECNHLPDAHHGSTYACRTAGCRCVRFTPDIARAAAVHDTLSTSARLARAEQERDELATAVAGWVARFHAAYEALYIEEFDGDSCPDLETTIEYAVGAYRRVCESEAAAADRIALLRAELASALQELAQLRAHLPQPDSETGGAA